MRSQYLEKYPELKDPKAQPRYTGIPTFMRTDYAANADGLDIALIGVPFDGGVTHRSGARLGPREVRVQSTMMRLHNQSTGVSPFEIAKVADIGDAWPINSFELVAAHKEIQEFFAEVVASNATPLSVGGDHSITLPILRAVAAKRPVALIQFDAHADTGGDYLGSKYHHGSTFSAAVEEGLIEPKRSVQMGIRGGTVVPDLWKFSFDSGMRVVSMDELDRTGIDTIMSEARNIVGDYPVYVSFDIDVMDPAFARGTGTPEVGGITSFQALKLVRNLRGLNTIGADVVEVAPAFDPSGNTGLVAASVMFELLCILAESRHNAEAGSR